MTIKFEGEFVNDKIHGQGKEYFQNYSHYIISFEGEFKEGKRWKGIGLEHYNSVGHQISFEGEYANGKNGKGKEYYSCSFLYFDVDSSNKRGELEYEGEYLDGKRNGQGKEYWVNGKVKFEGQYRNGERWNGKGYADDKNGNQEIEIKNGEGNQELLKDPISDCIIF